MAKVHSREIPYLTPRPCEDGSGWYVEAQWVGGAAEQLGHFKTNSEANDWINLESIAYFVLRELEVRKYRRVLQFRNNREHKL